MMNGQYKFSSKSLFSLVLLLLALVLAGMTAAEVIKIYRGDDQGAIQNKAATNDQAAIDKAGAKDKTWVKDKAAANDKGEDYYEAMVKRIAEAVKTGKLTEEQAQAKLAQIKKALGSKSIK